METIRGKTSLDMDLTALNERLAGHNRILLDLGTGDGRYVHCLAARNPGHFMIGLDSCRENLREHSRARLENMLFVIANARELPHELDGLISHISINFPWGSLLEGLLTGEPKLMSGLESVSSARASMQVHLNGGALAEAGCRLEDGAGQVCSSLLSAGWGVDSPMLMDINALRTLPTTWARRLAVGRDPRAISISTWMLHSEGMD